MTATHSIGIPRRISKIVQVVAATAMTLLPAGLGSAQAVDDDAAMLRDARYSVRRSAPERGKGAEFSAAVEYGANVDRYATKAAYESEQRETKPATRPAANAVSAEKPAGKLLPPKPAAAHKESETGVSSAESQATSRYPSVTTLIGSTCAVLSVFFALAWVLKRTAPRSLRGLPRDAVELLGRAPLARGQQMHLVRCGSRVLVLAVSASSTQTLAEISDPQEVDNLLLACGVHSAPHAPREERHHAERDGYSGNRVSELLASVTGAASGDEPARGGRAGRTPARGTMAALVGGRHA